MLLPCRTCAGRFRLLRLFLILFSQRKTAAIFFPAHRALAHRCPPAEGDRALLPAPSAASPLLPGGRQGNLAYRSGEISVTAAPRRQARGFPPFPSLHPALPSVCELSEPFSLPASHKHPPSAIRQNLFPAPFDNPQHLRTLHPVFSSSFDIRRNRGFDRMPPAWEPSGTAESGTLHGNKRRCALLRKPDKQAARPLPLCDAPSDRFMRTLTSPSFPASFSPPASPPQNIL